MIGARQVGKTTLAKKLREDTQTESLYLDLELDSHRIRLQDAESYLKLHEEKSIIIYEIQCMLESGPVLHLLFAASFSYRIPDFHFVEFDFDSNLTLKSTIIRVSGRVAKSLL